MSDADDLMKNYTSKAAQEVPALIEKLAADLGIDGENAKAAIGSALSRAFMRGVETGEAEIQAQTVEQGYDIRTTKLRPDDDWAYFSSFGSFSSARSRSSIRFRRPSIR